MLKCIFIILLLLFSISVASGQSATQKTWQVAEKVKAVVYDSVVSSKMAGNVLHETSLLNITSIFTTFGYKLGHQSSSVFGDSDVKVKYIQLQDSTERHNQEVRLALITGFHAESARMGLFELMGTRISLPIKSGTYQFVSNGPGDICFSMPSCVKSKGTESSVEKRIWFTRDNIGVELACSGDTDLLPIAKAIDQAIQSCPVKESKR